MPAAQIAFSERKCAANFAGSIFTKSDFTYSTTRSRTSAGSASTTAEWIEAGAAKDQPSIPSRFTIASNVLRDLLMNPPIVFGVESRPFCHRTRVPRVAVSRGKSTGLVGHLIA